MRTFTYEYEYRRMWARWATAVVQRRLGPDYSVFAHPDGRYILFTPVAGRWVTLHYNPILMYWMVRHWVWRIS